MEAIDEVIGRIMKRALAGSGRETTNVVLADGMCSRSKKAPDAFDGAGELDWEETSTVDNADRTSDDRLARAPAIGNRCSVTDVAADRAAQVNEVESPSTSG